MEWLDSLLYWVVTHFRVLGLVVLLMVWMFFGVYYIYVYKRDVATTIRLYDYSDSVWLAGFMLVTCAALWPITDWVLDTIIKIDDRLNSDQPNN